MIESKEIRLERIKKENPTLTVELSFMGSVIDVENNTVYVRLTDEFDIEPEMEAEMDIKLFPQKDFKKGIYFWLCIGETIKNGQPENFVHINYFYWTKEDIDEAMIRAKEFSEKMKDLFIEAPKAD